MCFWGEKYKQKKELLEVECNSLYEELNMAVGAANSYFANPNMFIDVSTADMWINKYSYLLSKVDKSVIKRYKKCIKGKELAQKASVLLNIPGTLKNNIINHNDNLAKKLIDEGYRLIGNVEGRRLDEQQMMSIVKPSMNHLIIAGAGTGKTTTIVGKIKYLWKIFLFFLLQTHLLRR